MASPSRKLTSVCLAVIVLLALTATIFRKLEIPSSRKLKTEELRSAKNNSTMAAKR
ncbi:BnaA08g29790D [Brassica napus]|nr:BnaA08g29790D [Brassica napus]